MIKKISHICYVDDDLNEQYLFSRALNGLPNTPTLKVICSCMLLLAYLDNQAEPLPDMIFLDYNMPGISSLECLKQIKGNSLLLDIPIVMYSPSEQNRNIKYTKETGVYKYILKPLSFDETRQELKRVISEYENGSA
ncbi:MAG: response regulator [Chitinophagaceae bacterium]|nr:response regulator [Chitinophagaceae bacterium]